MFVSIIIPYYKDPKNIFKSVSSVFSQTFKNFELIIVDNEKSYSSKEVLRKIKNKFNSTIIIHNKFLSSTAGTARNYGIKKSKGDLIAFLDSDDYWNKNKLELQIKYLQIKKLDILFTNFIGINEKKKTLYKVAPPSNLLFSNFIKSCPVCCSSVLIRKKCFKKFLFEIYKTKEDYSLWLRFSKHGFKMGTINKYLTFYTIRSASLSSMHFNKLRNAFCIYYNSMNFSFVYSVFCVIRLYFNAFKKKYL